MSAIPRSSNKAIHDALRVLAREIQSGDGAANVAIAEGADRISELGNEVEQLERENAALLRDKERLDSRTIRIIHRDDLGNPSPCIHSGIDLRAAIDAAREEGGAS